MTIAVEELARQLYVDPGDVQVFAAMLGESVEIGPGARLPDDVGGEIRMILDPHAERTLPEMWSQAAMDTWREENGLRPPGGLNHAPGRPLGPSPGAARDSDREP